MVCENGVKNMQAAAYNGARTVYILVSVGDQNFDENPTNFRPPDLKFHNPTETNVTIICRNDELSSTMS